MLGENIACSSRRILRGAVEYYKGNNIMEIMDKCLKVNPNAIHEKDSGNDEPIHLALCENRDIKIVEYLFEKGSKITKENAGKIFRGAVQYYKGNNIMEIMDKCLKVNPDAIHAKDANKEEPIHLAIINYRDIKIVQYLFENGVNINAVGYDNRTPIMYANKDINKET
eukprot:68445_1